jgi:hypothetical protein
MGASTLKVRPLEGKLTYILYRLHIKKWVIHLSCTGVLCVIFTKCFQTLEIHPIQMEITNNGKC